MKFDWQSLRALLPQPDGRTFVVAHDGASLTLELYAPQGRDDQQPHSRDELYVVLRGSGRFDNGGALQPFQPGDAFFVPAHRPHRFVDFTDDFATWVVFAGPERAPPSNPREMP